MKRKLTILLAFATIFNISQAQDKQKDKNADSTENKKKGITFGLIPTVSYSSDLGIQYGGMVTFYNYGDGSTYPKYRHLLRMEVSRYTKGTGTNQIFFDSDKLFRKRTIRLTSDLSYLTEKALDFYGFNGAMTIFNMAFSDDQDSNYISRMFYRMERKMVRFTCDFQGAIIPGKLKWLGGFAFFNYQMGTVDIDRLNEGKDESKKLPDTTLLYDHYVNWGLISPEEADGGHNQLIKAGLIWDTRDIEANPSKGIWAEALVLAAPSFLGNSENSFAKLVLIHRQYFTLVPKRLTFVYRLGYMGTIAGKAPFYSQSYMFNSFSMVTIVEGLGGGKSLRGVIRDRVVGDGIAWGNFEFRWKFINTIIGKQNVYLALNPFCDIGRVIKPIDVDLNKVPDNVEGLYFSDANSDKFHITFGCGLHVALNENFVITFDFGKSPDIQNGKRGVYIGTNWLF